MRGRAYVSPMIGFTRGIATLLLVGTAMIGCVDNDQAQKMVQTFQASSVRPDELPRILNKELPFRYPAALYARKVQGNVTLRLFIDKDGRVHPESTQVLESSGYASFDSAAIRGSEELRFVPAKLRGEPMAVTTLFPVYFRYPGAAPLPGDTILKQKPEERGTRK